MSRLFRYNVIIDISQQQRLPRPVPERVSCCWLYIGCSTQKPLETHPETKILMDELQVRYFRQHGLFRPRMSLCGTPGLQFKMAIKNEQRMRRRETVSVCSIQQRVERRGVKLSTVCRLHDVFYSCVLSFGSFSVSCKYRRREWIGRDLAGNGSRVLVVIIIFVRSVENRDNLNSNAVPAEIWSEKCPDINPDR